MSRHSFWEWLQVWHDFGSEFVHNHDRNEPKYSMAKMNDITIPCPYANGGIIVIKNMYTCLIFTIFRLKTTSFKRIGLKVMLYGKFWTQNHDKSDIKEVISCQDHLNADKNNI